MGKRASAMHTEKLLCFAYIHSITHTQQHQKISKLALKQITELKEKERERRRTKIVHIYLLAEMAPY